MSRIVFFDLETGGSEVSSPIIQIGAVATESFKEVGSFERKLAFDEKTASQEALTLNHYDPVVWAREAVAEAVALRAFKDFLDRYHSVDMVSKIGKPYKVTRIGGHNVSAFDLPRLSSAFRRHGLFLPVQFNSVLDTLHGAAWYLERYYRAPLTGPAPKNVQLRTLAESFGIGSEGVHDALADARISARLAEIFS